MMRVAQPIGVAEIAGAFLVSVPPRLSLVVSLRKAFRGVQAAAEPWTYRIPARRGTGRQIEEWLAEVELQARAEARRRAWSATEAEWSGAVAPQAGPPRPAATVPVAVAVPRKRTAKDVLDLLGRLADGAILVVAVKDGARSYRLAPSGRQVRTAVAERTIRDRFVLPGNDGLFGPETSQTWRAPTTEDLHAAMQRGRPRGPARRGDGPVHPARSPARPRTRRPPQGGRQGQEGPLVGDRRGPALPLRKRGVE